jgi:hypothetical protein
MTEPLTEEERARLVSTMDALSEQVHADLEQSRRQTEALAQWRREQFLRSRPVGGLDLSGEGRGNVFVVEKLSDAFHLDLWRVQCKPEPYGGRAACHGCGRTVVLHGDDFRFGRVTSCHDFDAHGVAEEATT